MSGIIPLLWVTGFVLSLVTALAEMLVLGMMIRRLRSDHPALYSDAGSPTLLSPDILGVMARLVASESFRRSDDTLLKRRGSWFIALYRLFAAAFIASVPLTVALLWLTARDV